MFNSATLPSAVLIAALALPTMPVLAGDSFDDIDQVELAMALELDSDAATPSTEQELVEDLGSHYPDAAQAWPDLPEDRQAILIAQYRDAGYLPAIASAVTGVPAMPD